MKTALLLSLTALTLLLTACGGDSSHTGNTKNSGEPAPQKPTCWFSRLTPESTSRLAIALNEFNATQFGLNTYSALENIKKSGEDVTALESFMVTQVLLEQIGVDAVSTLIDSGDYPRFFEMIRARGLLMAKLDAQSIRTCGGKTN